MSHATPLSSVPTFMFWFDGYYRVSLKKLLSNRRQIFLVLNHNKCWASPSVPSHAMAVQKKDDKLSLRQSSRSNMCASSLDSDENMREHLVNSIFPAVYHKKRLLPNAN